VNSTAQSAGRDMFPETDGSACSIGEAMYRLAVQLFPLCRSLTGDGVRASLELLRQVVPLEMHEVPSGTAVLDWTVPPEWNIRDAYVADEHGRRLIDFRQSNLHVVGYSVPFRGRLSFDELDGHLHSLPEQPDVVPYITSYYAERWGFCCSHRQRQALRRDATYDVVIDSTLAPGSLTYADLVIPGRREQEILLSTNICHPSMANNDVSGMVLSAHLAAAAMVQREREYTYRFVFIPETIGAVTYLARHLHLLRRNVVAGWTVTCVGDDGPFSYLSSRFGSSLADRATIHALEHAAGPYRRYDYLERGSDERQYCAPGVDLPVCSLMRSKYTEYPEYHTSADDLSFISPEGLAASFAMYRRCLELVERNAVYRVTVLGEPQLGKRGLYPSLSTTASSEPVRTMMNLLSFSDGAHDLLAVADRIGVPAWELYELVDTLRAHGLLDVVDDGGQNVP